MPTENLQEQARLLAREVLAVYADEVDQQRVFPHASINALRKTKLWGLMVPAEFGGPGGSLEEMTAVLEALGTGCASTAMILLMHYCATAVLAGAASRHLQQQVLPAIARGEHLSTLALSEFGSGGHFYAPVSRVSKNGGSQIRLNAAKSFVTAAHQANSYVVSSRSADAEGSDLYLVRNTIPGVKVNNSFLGLGLAANDSASVHFAVEVSENDRIGAAGAGLDTMLKIVLPCFQLGSAAVSVGIAQAALDFATAHAGKRKYEHTPSSLADIPRVQFLLAEITIAVRSARSYLARAASAAVAGVSDAMLDLLAVKTVASEAAQAAAARAMTIGGGTAFGKRGGMERIFRDAQAASVMAPAGDLLKEFIGKAVLGLPLF